MRTPWYAKRKSYRVLFWREITPLAVPIFLENTCVLLMGVLSTFLVSWLGKEAMAGVGLADSFNMVVMSFFAAIDLGTTVVVAFSLGKLDPKRAREAARQSLMIMTLFSIILAAVIHYYGKEIIDIVAGEATSEVKDLALTYLEMTVLSYPAAAIALIGSGALRGAGNTKIPLLINGGMNILNIIISSVLIYGVFSWEGLGFVGAGLGLTISRYIGAAAIIGVLMAGITPSLRLTLKSYFRPLNFAIIWEVMGIGIPASIESVLFNGGKLLTQMFVAGMGTDVIAGNFIAFSIADRPGLTPGLIGGMLAVSTGSGFIGGIIAGFLAGYVAKLISSKLKLPQSMEALKPILIIPLISSLVVGLAMIYLIGKPVAGILEGLTHWLQTMGTANAVLLGAILGGMMCTDMGGPVNKAAYAFGVGLLSTQTYAPMAAIMAAGMVPPLALGLATIIARRKFDKAQQEGGKAALVLGLCFITEGAIPFAARDPMRVLPCCIVGGAVTGAISMAVGAKLMAPHGGLFVLFIPGAITPVLGYLLAIVAGTLVAGLSYAVLKRPEAEVVAKAA